MASDDDYNKGLFDKIDDGATKRALSACYVLGTDFSKVESSKDIEKIFKRVVKKKLIYQRYQAHRQIVLDTLLDIKKNLNYLMIFLLVIAGIAILLKVNYLAVIQLPAITLTLVSKKTIDYLVEFLFGEKKKKEKNGRK